MRISYEMHLTDWAKLAYQHKTVKQLEWRLGTT